MKNTKNITGPSFGAKPMTVKQAFVTAALEKKAAAFFKALRTQKG